MPATCFYLRPPPWKYVDRTRDNLSLVTDTIEGQLLHSHICLHARSSTGDSFSLKLAPSVDTDYKASFNLKMDPEPKQLRNVNNIYFKGDRLVQMEDYMVMRGRKVRTVKTMRGFAVVLMAFK